jgi:hypothetical protein
MAVNQYKSPKRKRGIGFHRSLAHIPRLRFGLLWPDMALADHASHGA